MKKRLVEVDAVVKNLKQRFGDKHPWFAIIASCPSCFVDDDLLELIKLYNGEYADSDSILRCLGISFKEAVHIFEMSRECEWWSMCGKTEEERSRNGQKVTIKFKRKDSHE